MPKAIAIEEPVARYRALLGPVGKSVVHPGAALALPRPRIAKAWHRQGKCQGDGRFAAQHFDVPSQAQRAM
jgi:hypothetical protein